MSYRLLCLVAHVLGDFVFEPDDVSRDRASFLRHGLKLFVCFLVFLHAFGVEVSLVTATLLTLFHLFLEYCGHRITRRCFAEGTASRRKFGVFAGGQMLNVAAVGFMARILREPRFSSRALEFYPHLFPRTFSAPPGASAARGLTLDRGLVVVLAYLTVTFVGARVVRYGLDALGVTVEVAATQHAGKYIGMLERILILTFVLADALPSIAFVLTAKSLARYRELAEMRFAEYYLIGTLGSTCVALLTGLAARWVLDLL